MYLVTGASGFIARLLLDALTKRGQTIYCLFYPPAVGDFKDLVEQRWPSARARCSSTTSVPSSSSWASCQPCVSAMEAKSSTSPASAFKPTPRVSARTSQARPPGPEAVAFAHIMHGIHW